MSGGWLLGPAERDRVDGALATVRDAADELRGVARRVLDRPGVRDWSGPAAVRHDRWSTGLAGELHALAAMLEDLADDGGHAMTVAARLASRGGGPATDRAPATTRWRAASPVPGAVTPAGPPVVPAPSPSSGRPPDAARMLGVR